MKKGVNAPFLGELIFGELCLIKLLIMLLKKLRVCKKSAIYIFLFLSVLYTGCRKEQVQTIEPYTQNETFFSRSGEIKSIGTIQSNSAQSFRSSDVIDTILTMLREADLKEKFANKVIKKYGYAKWDKSIIVNNENRLKTVIVPIADSNNQVQSLIFAYQIDKNNAAFKIIDKSTKQNKLPLHGDKDGKTFTQQTLKGLFQILEERIKYTAKKSNVSNSSITKNGIFVEWDYWFYTSYNENGDYTTTTTQCSYRIRFTHNLMMSFEVAPIEFPSGGLLPIYNKEDLFREFDENIEDSLTNDCLKQILAQIKALKKGKIAEIINKFSGDIPNWNWKLKEGPLDPTKNGRTSLMQGGAETTLDFNKLKNATSLASARTIIHESVHAYLTVYFRYDSQNASKDYPGMVKAWMKSKHPDYNQIQHDQMVFTFVKEIANALKEFGISIGLNLNDSIYNDMAWGGLDFSNNSNLSDDDKERIQHRLSAEQTNSTFGNEAPSSKKTCN
ncbi:MAG: hypothetical protein EAZ12_00285 [Sphingobacteriia bacterium]|nr:MAG: hypothetical protein EAZ12_00285 [Sphingobacteriia bacterium]